MKLFLVILNFLFLSSPCFADDSIVVHILCEGGQGGPSTGTGVVTSADGHVLTAAHVMPDGSRCTASLGTAIGDRVGIVREQVAENFDAALARLESEQVFQRYATFCSAMAEREIISVAFHPNAGDTPSRKQGIISKVEIRGGAMEITNQVLAGESGGPVFLKGTTALVGIVQGQTSDAQGNPIRWMVPTGELQGFGLTPAVDCSPKREDASVEILALLAQQKADQSDLLEMAFQSGVTEAQLIALAQRIDADTQTREEALVELENAVNVAIDIQKRGSAPSNTGPFVDEVLREVARLSNAGSLDAASERVNNALAELDLAEASVRMARLELLEMGIATDVQRRDATAAAAKVTQKLRLETEDEDLFPVLREEQNRWFVRGRDYGAAIDLEVSIALASEAITLAQDADQRGQARNDLGNALSRLGMGESGTARLEEAVVVYRAALEELTRERVPLEWAQTQNNLGTAFARLGERESGTARLEEAVAAYRAALRERTRERAPLEWARTQMNLGAALAKLGERENGTARLDEAVAAYRAALRERTRERVPLEWARTQMNLGAALARLGTRESSTERLEEAVVAYRVALVERTRERVPLEWARTQMNLGAALARLGARKSGTERLEEAVTAYRAALKERTRDRVPLDWARTQMNLGRVLARLGARENGTARLEEAIALYEEALEERTRDRVPLEWAYTLQEIAETRVVIFDRTAEVEMLNGAIAELKNAREIYVENNIRRRLAEIDESITRIQRKLVRE